jgi:hypothetical protein
MPAQRKDDQTVETFSAPKALLESVRNEAAQRGLTRSGFIRYCLAKEVGFSEEEAKEFALPGTVQMQRKMLNKSDK